jgi:heat-inducible transcriptional repressor
MTNMTAGAIGPDSSTQCLEHIKLFPIDERNAVCVFITNTGHTETRTFHFDEDVPFSDIETCTDVLNSKLHGTPVAMLPEKMEEIKPELSTVVQRHDLLFTAFVRAFVKFASENIYFSGKDRMLYQPEFEDINKLKQLMSMLDDSSVWRQIGTDTSKMSVTTTKGTELTWINDVAIVRSRFHVNDQESGQLLVVGPSRMNYERVVSMLDYVAQMIERMYRKEGGGKP